MLFQAIYTSIRELAPINLGDLADYNLQTELALTFVLLAYPGWHDILYVIISHCICNVGIRFTFYKCEKSFGNLLAKFVFSSIFATVGLASFTVIVGWIGVRYIESEMSRLS